MHFFDREHGEDCLDGTGGAQKMAYRAFGAADVDLGGLRSTPGAEHERLDRSVLGGVAQRGGRGMRVDVVDCARRESGVLQRAPHG